MKVTLLIDIEAISAYHLHTYDCFLYQPSLGKDSFMKSPISVLILLVVASLIIPQSLVWGQQKSIALSPQKSVVPLVSVFVAGNYFGPKFTGVNAVYNTIESNFSLPSGTDFKNYYFVMAGVRINPTSGQAFQGEFGGSILKSPKDNSTNFLQEYYGGGSYIRSLPISMVSIYGGGGLGYIWLNTQRTYTTRPGVAQVNAQLAQLHGLLGLQFFAQSGVSFSLEGRYNYATTVSPLRADLDFTMKGFAGGIQIGIPIIM